MEGIQCDFNLFLVYSCFKPVFDNKETNNEIMSQKPYVWFELASMADIIIYVIRYYVTAVINRFEILRISK